MSDFKDNIRILTILPGDNPTGKTPDPFAIPPFAPQKPVPKEPPPPSAKNDPGGKGKKK